ncbi:MAG: hypothetical protein LBR18_04090 [Tannerella sp.]|jgi:tetratricopeptide (TPR) repeat protein|nr:hypothetical protein [Tannerella sp.]
MTTTDIHALYSKATIALDKSELKNTFDILTKMLADAHDYTFTTRLENMQETYHRMLFYFSKGVKDEKRSEIRLNLKEEVYELADEIKQKLLTNESVSIYYSTKRTLGRHSDNIIKLVDILRVATSHEEENKLWAALNQLFKLIWTSDKLTVEEYAVLHELLSEKAPKTDKRLAEIKSVINCQIVSALVLALQAMFDRQKIFLLFDATANADHEVNIRALTGVLLTLFTYCKRIECQKDITHRIDALAETPDFVKTVSIIVQKFLLSRQTEKITHKLKNELLPEMLKLHPKYNSDQPIRFITPEDFEADANPEWLDKLSKSDLHSKMEELQEMQEEGADVMHFSFINLKHFPFFNEIGNWFLPFNKCLPFFAGDEDLLKTLEMITGVGFLCNSDMYSFFLSLKHLSEDERTKISSQLEEQIGQLKEQKKSEIQTRFNKSEIITGQYVQDLYRFYKLFQRKSEFDDIFQYNLDFQNMTVLMNAFSDTETLRNLAELYLRKDYYESALEMFERLNYDSPEPDEVLLQKMGFCHQMVGRHQFALEEYLKAELINPNSKWLLRRIAQCYRSLKEYDKALEYYFRFEKIEPENISVLLGIGACYLDKQDFDEALKYYFKADYLEQKTHKAWRPVAWCSFVTGKIEQAQKYYQKVLSHSPDYQDYMNAGHVEWALQNNETAIEYYKESIKLYTKDDEQFRKEFKRDLPYLIAAHIDIGGIQMMIDEATYQLSS